MDPIEVLATVGVFGVVVKAVVQAIRRQWPMNGLTVQLLSVVLGAGAAWAFDLRATSALLAAANASVGRLPVAAVDYLITGVAIAAAAGVVAEVAKGATVEIATGVAEVSTDASVSIQTGSHEST